nr:FliM/FliN family flagellar motor switch protein [Sansalvadorimonas sp. 2012CJ34-2]
MVESEQLIGPQQPKNQGSHKKEDVFDPTTTPDFSIIGDIPVLLTLEVGGREMSISEISALKVGSIVTLTHKETDPLDVKVNGVLVAKGEVVLAGDYYGVRILSLTQPSPYEAALKP